jgi:hypothetical protein
MQFSRSTLKEFVTLARQTFGIAPRGTGPRVWFSERADRFAITARHNNTWLEYRQEGDFPRAAGSLPWEACLEAAQAKTRELTLTLEGPTSRLRWTEQGTDVERRSQDGSADELEPIPDAERWKRMRADLLTAFQEAARTTDPNVVRYALGCLCLRGKQKDIVATDSRQLLIQKGFDWPWKADLLVEASRCFRSAALQQAADSGPIEIGRAKHHLLLRIGCWRVGLPLVTGSRFPDVDSIVPPDEAIATTLSLDDSDREFLCRELLQLPDTELQKVTIDLNGTVAVRSPVVEDSPAKELVLSNSRRDGPGVAIDCDRRYLGRLADFGLSRIEIGALETPLVARNERHTYLWMGLSGDPTPRPGNLEQIVSPRRETGPEPDTSPSHRKEPLLTKHNDKTRQSASHDSNGATAATETDPVDQLIEQANQIKTKLKDLQTELQDLITALKSQKKQARLVRTTLDSLQKLNTLQV